MVYLSFFSQIAQWFQTWAANIKIPQVDRRQGCRSDPADHCRGAGNPLFLLSGGLLRRRRLGQGPDGVEPEGPRTGKRAVPSLQKRRLGTALFAKYMLRSATKREKRVVER